MGPPHSFKNSPEYNLGPVRTPVTKQDTVSCSSEVIRAQILQYEAKWNMNLKLIRITDLLHFLVQDLLHELAKALKLGLVLLHLLLLLLILWQLQALFSDRDQALAIKLLQLLDAVLVNGLRHVQDLEATFADALNEGRVGHLILALTLGCQIFC